MSKQERERGDTNLECQYCYEGKNIPPNVEKVFPTDIDIEVARYSKYSAITPFDHPQNILESSPDSIGGYSVSPVVQKMNQQMVEWFNIYYDVEKHPLWESFQQLGDEFKMVFLEQTDKELAESLQKIKDKQLRKEKLRRKLDYWTNGLFSAMFNKEAKPHWKELQDPVERQLMLTKAELKRTKREYKKNKTDSLLVKIKQLEKLIELYSR